MLCVSVVEVALTGLCIEFVSVVVVVLWEVCTGTSLTVVQAVSDTKAAAAKHEMIIVFIVVVCCFVVIYFDIKLKLAQHHGVQPYFCLHKRHLHRD